MTLTPTKHSQQHKWGGGGGGVHGAAHNRPTTQHKCLEHNYQNKTSSEIKQCAAIPVGHTTFDLEVTQVIMGAQRTNWWKDYRFCTDPPQCVAKMRNGDHGSRM